MNERQSPDGPGVGYIEGDADDVRTGLIMTVGRVGNDTGLMRPVILNPLFAALTSLSGVGPKLEKLYARLLGREDEMPRVIDLLFHLPSGFVDRATGRNSRKFRPTRW